MSSFGLGDLEHKKSLYFRYRDKFGEEEIIRRLGLKDWEVRYLKIVDRRAEGQDKKQP